MLTREELIGYVDKYLAALAARDASRLPAIASLRYTENGQDVALGNGLWTTATPPRAKGNYFTDAQTGQVGFFGVAHEGEKPLILGLRLKIDAGRIGEVESVISRPGGNVFNPDSVSARRPAYEEVLAPSGRRSRAELIAITHSYFNGIEHRDGSMILVHEECARIENGVITAKRPADAAALGGNAEMARRAQMGVAAQISAGIHGYITRVRDRRVLTVDEERGMTFGVYMFDHDGGDYIELRDGTRREMPAFARTPSTAMIWEAFKIEDGLITAVEAIGTVLPHGTKPGWAAGAAA
jgi:hypothetical protein